MYLRTGQLLNVLHTDFEDGKTTLVLCQTTCSIMPRLLYLRIAGRTSNQYHNGIVHTLSSKNIVSYVPLFPTRTNLLGGIGCKWLVHEMKVYLFSYRQHFSRIIVYLLQIATKASFIHVLLNPNLGIQIRNLLN